MGMYVTATLIVAPELARALHDGDESSPLLKIIREARAALYPMPAYSRGEPGERTFLIEGGAGDEQTLCDRLLEIDGVESCFVKPQDSPP